MKICTSLTEEEGCELVDQFIRNVDLFAYALSDTPNIYTRVISHCLAINPFSKPVDHRKQRVCDEKKVDINKEVGKLSSAEFNT